MAEQIRGSWPVGDLIGSACPDDIDGTVSNVVVERFNNRALLVLCG